MIRAVIIDDQPPARADLRALLAAYPDVAVTGEAGMMGRARTLLASGNYDVVFLDIQLREGESFELLPDVRREARVVFVTAFDEYAVRAFETAAIDYLLKPVTPERLARTVERLRLPPAAGSATPFEPAGPLVPVKVGPVTRLLHVHEICVVTSSENYTEVVLASGEKVFVRRTMQQWEELLPTPQFTRVHRALIVNLAHIARLERVLLGGLKLHLSRGGTPLEVHRRHGPALRTVFAHWQEQGRGRSASPS